MLSQSRVLWVSNCQQMSGYQSLPAYSPYLRALGLIQRIPDSPSGIRIKKCGLPGCLTHFWCVLYRCLSFSLFPQSRDLLLFPARSSIRSGTVSTEQLWCSVLAGKSHLLPACNWHIVPAQDQRFPQVPPLAGEISLSGQHFPSCRLRYPVQQTSPGQLEVWSGCCNSHCSPISAAARKKFCCHAGKGKDVSKASFSAATSALLHWGLCFYGICANKFQRLIFKHVKNSHSLNVLCSCSMRG